MGKYNITMGKTVFRFRRAIYGENKYLILFNSHSNWIEAYLLPDIKNASTPPYLKIPFSNHGIPFILVTDDNGSTFTGNEFKLFTSENGIKHITTVPYHPSSNRPAEQAVQSFKTAMKKNCEKESVDINTVICRHLLAYHNTPQTSTKLSFAELLHTRRLNTRLF